LLGQKAMTNFVSFAPGATAPRHVHEEEQIVVVLDGEFTFDLDGDVRVMRKGDVAVIPSWVPHGAWTTDTHCLEVDVVRAAADQPAQAGRGSGGRERDGCRGCRERDGLPRLSETGGNTAGEE